MSTVVPPAWIIEEERRREEARRRKEREGDQLPVDAYEHEAPPKDDEPSKSTVIIIDI